MGLQIKSQAFQENGGIPEQYTCDGKNISPPLNWQGAPEGTQSLVLIVDDPDAPSQTWVHWVVYNISPTTAGSVEGAAPQGALQGTNDFKKASYGGPCPPSGTHRYFFKLYALDAPLKLSSGATKNQVEEAMQGHILAQSQLMGTYSRD